MTKKILEVPYIRQKINFCGPACLAMVMQYHGLEITQDDIGYEMCAHIWSPRLEDLSNFARKKGFYAEIKECSMYELLTSVSEGNPVIVRQRRSYLNEAGHARLVIGYDTIEKRIIFHDPEIDKELDISFKLFRELWRLPGLSDMGLLIRKLQS